MPRYEQHLNAKVGREQAEVLQQKLFAAASYALDTAMEEGKGSWEPPQCLPIHP